MNTRVSSPSLPPTGDQRSREKAAELRGTIKGPLEVETDVGRRGGPKQPIKTLGKSAAAQTRRAGPERKVSGGWGGGWGGWAPRPTQHTRPDRKSLVVPAQSKHATVGARPHNTGCCPTMRSLEVKPQGRTRAACSPRFLRLYRRAMGPEPRFSGPPFAGPLSNPERAYVIFDLKYINSGKAWSCIRMGVTE